LAIGDPATLEQALAMPGGFKDSLTPLSGVEIAIETSGQIILPAAEAKELKWGKPVE